MVSQAPGLTEVAHQGSAPADTSNSTSCQSRQRVPGGFVPTIKCFSLEVKQVILPIAHSVSYMAVPADKGVWKYNPPLWLKGEKSRQEPEHEKFLLQVSYPNCPPGKNPIFLLIQWKCCGNYTVSSPHASGSLHIPSAFSTHQHQSSCYTGF